MGTVSSHSAFLCVDQVGSKRSCCACDSTSGFCTFDVHRDTRLKQFRGYNPVSIADWS